MADRKTFRSSPAPTRLLLAAGGIVALAVAAIVPNTITGPATASAQPQPAVLTPATQPEVDAWRQSVWTTASNGNLDETLALLADVPEDADPGATADLRSSVELLLTNIEKRDTKRAEQIEQEWQEFRDALAEARDTRDDADVSEALALALLLETLVEDREAFHNKPEVVELIDLAADAARQAEADEDWLAASELFARLNLLTEASQEFKADLQRQILRRD
ncbi:MAG: hypothetical protein AAFY46_12915, partial [Planctomycetota bacterium]